MSYGPSQFQSTIVKPYYKDNSSKPVQNALKDTLEDTLEDTSEDTLEDALENAPEDAPKDALEDALEENYNQYALEGDYNSNIIVVDIL